MTASCAARPRWFAGPDSRRRLRQIVAHADGPRGSLQRYFPGGKTQLITEALKLVGAEVLDDTESRLIEAATLADAIDAIFAPWRQVLIDSNFTMGCPIAATVVDASGTTGYRKRLALSSISGARRYAGAWSDSASGNQHQRTMPPRSSLLSRAPSSCAVQTKDPATRRVQRFFTRSLTRAQMHRRVLAAVASRRADEELEPLTPC